MVIARTYLAIFLFYRIVKEGKDGRFDKIRNNPKRFAIAWFLQGVWIFLVALPTLITNVSKRQIALDGVAYGNGFVVIRVEYK